MRIYIDEKQFEDRVERNRKRLCSDEYDIDHVFQGNDAGWPGDKEGRALLAFVSHYRINATKIPCMDLIIDRIPDVTGGRSYFGPKPGEILFEQQLSGHSWYLRGLCEYYERFHDERVLKYLTDTVEALYLPTKGRYIDYPLCRNSDAEGGVSGHSAQVLDGWRLSTDVGCAFMSIDGLSHYYQLTESREVKELLDEMIEVFDRIDKVKICAQTHCTLTAARGMMRMYGLTRDRSYLGKAKRIFDLYVSNGMTYTYQNFNWFGKGDTWTEPCAVVDSLMLAVMLYRATREEAYRKYAARIYFNGFATLQRPNGGAGTDTTVSATTSFLKITKMYEAPFCCTMRLAEGLRFIKDHRDVFFAETKGWLTRDAYGRYADGDLLYAEIPAEFEKYADAPQYADGHKLFPIVSFYTLENEEKCRKIAQKIVFD